VLSLNSWQDEKIFTNRITITPIHNRWPGTELIFSKEPGEGLFRRIDPLPYKSPKTKKTGAIISLTGASTVILGIALISTNREAAGYMGLGIGVTGIGITLVGLPILATGSSRIKKVSKAFNARYNNIGQVHLVPCSIYNYQTRNIQPGIALRINF